MKMGKPYIYLILTISLLIFFQSCASDNFINNSPITTSAPVINNENISKFWEVFIKNRQELSYSNSPVYDEILISLNKIAPNLFFEYSIKKGENVLIITAEGNRALFSIVEAIVAQAPAIPDWKIYALRPAEGFPKTATWENFIINISEVYFYLEDRPDSRLDLIYVVPGLNERDKLKCHSALLVATDHGIGEKRFAESVVGTDVIALSVGANVSKYLPLTELGSVLSSRIDK
jgi:hypothetical protein